MAFLSQIVARVVPKILFVVLVCLFSSLPVFSQETPDKAPDNAGGSKGPTIVTGPDFTLTEEVFRDWRVVCKDDKADTPKAGETICQMLQTAPAVTDGPTVFLLSISPGDTSTKNSSKAKRNFAVVTVPSGVYLAPGIEMHVDKRRPFKVLYEICDQVGCHAGFRLSGSVLSAFKRGTLAKVRVWTAKKKAVEFKVSLSGFTAAYNFYTSKISEKVAK